MNNKTVELKLRNIVNKNTPKSITIDKKKYYISRPMLDNIKLQEEKNGGILPLIPLIIGGLAAAGSVAGGAAGIAQAVNKDKSEKAALEEQKRHNEELEKAARGQGIIPDPIETFISKLNLVTEGKKVLKNVLQGIDNLIEIKETKDGSGIYLSPSMVR